MLNDNLGNPRLRMAVRLALTGGSLAGCSVAVLGLAFKAGSDDIRNSPALEVASAVGRRGATVRAFDPAAMANARRAVPGLGYARSVTEAACGADVVLLLTEWPEFRQASPGELAAVVAHPNIVDGRNALDPASWRAAGWQYRAPGRPDPPACEPAGSADDGRPAGVALDAAAGTGRQQALSPRRRVAAAGAPGSV